MLHGILWVSLLAAIVVPLVADAVGTAADDESAPVIHSPSWALMIRELSPDVLFTVLFGAVAAFVAAGWSGVSGAVSSLLGVDDSEAATLRGLTAWARGTLGAGLVMGLAALLDLIFQGQQSLGGDHAAPQAIAASLTTTIVAPGAGIVIGRLWLGSYADAVRRRRGETEPAFGSRYDLALLGLLVPPLIAYLLVFTPWTV